MKKLLLLTTTICFLTTCFGQQFSFQMFFTDAVGNKDTITLGYAVTATDSIDTAFGEVNIISVPFDTAALDVRITNAWFDFSSPVYFHTKKQIIFYDCTYTNWSIPAINIVTHHWPVTVAWDFTLFNDNCRRGSVFTSVNPGGWWDTVSPSDLWRAELFYTASPKTFTNNYQLGMFGYIDGSGELIPVYWSAFGDIGLILTSVSENPSNKTDLKLFPNPSTSKFSFEIPKEFGNTIKLEIYSSSGNLMAASENSTTLDLTSFKNGIYFIVLTNDRGEKLKTIAMKV